MTYLIPGIFGGKIFKGTNPEKKGVKYGPNTHKKPEDPVEDLIQKTMGKIPMEPNGLVYVDPNKVEYLKS